MLSPDVLDLPLWQGQVSAKFGFEAVTAAGARRGTLTPLSGSPPTLEHDTTSTISRRISGLTLGAADAAWFNPLTDRVRVTMTVGGQDWPLGRYLVAAAPRTRYSRGDIVPLTLVDEMLVVDQDLDDAFNAGGLLIDQAAERLLDGLPIGPLYAEATQVTSVGSWAGGTSRANALLDLATAGGYWKPWFDHEGRLRMVRAREPGDQEPDIDLDSPPRVLRDSITETGDDLLSAPNRYVVVSNSTGGSMSTNDAVETAETVPVVGVYDVPASAPYSAARRGFVISKRVEAQVPSQTAAAVYARTLGMQRSLYEQVELSTPPDPRHDSYQVVRWDGRLWLETGWSMALAPGGVMRHKLRRAYPSAGEEEVGEL